MHETKSLVNSSVFKFIGRRVLSIAIPVACSLTIFSLPAAQGQDYPNADPNQSGQVFQNEQPFGNQPYQSLQRQPRLNQYTQPQRGQGETTPIGQSAPNYDLEQQDTALAIPQQCRNKIETTPNFWQKDPRANFPDGGKAYCGPVAASDALMWFGKNGFQRLIPSASDEYTAQEKLIRIIASKNFMETKAAGGTSPVEIIKGILKLSAQRGYRLADLEYQGITPKIPPQFRTGNAPDLRRICENTLGNSGEILEIGWYKYNPNNNSYVRTSGHFIDVVGYAEFRGGQSVLPALIVHNPATGKQALLKVEQLTSGSLQMGKHKAAGFPLRITGRQLGGRQANGKRPAAGMYKIISGLPAIENEQPGENKVAIIEGSIVFRL